MVSEGKEGLPETEFRMLLVEGEKVFCSFEARIASRHRVS